MTTEGTLLRLWSSLNLVYRLLICLVLCFLLFWWTIGFELRQASALAVIFALFLVEKSIWKPHPRAWRPYFITFQTDYAKMLLDLRLIESFDQWRTLLANRDIATNTDLDLERRPVFSCFNLVEKTSSNGGLLMWRPWDYFSTSMNVTFTIRAISVPDESTMGRFEGATYHPEFFLANRTEGYKFGITLQKSWWVRLTHSHPEVVNKVIEVIDRNINSDTSDVDLVMGEIPLLEICHRYHFRYEESELFQKHMEKVAPLQESLDRTEWVIGPKWARCASLGHSWITST